MAGEQSTQGIDCRSTKGSIPNPNPTARQGTFHKECQVGSIDSTVVRGCWYENRGRSLICQ